MAPYSKFEQQIIQRDGKILFEMRRSPRSILSYIFTFLVLTAVVSLIIYFFPDNQVMKDVPIIKHISPRWLALLPLLVLFEMFRKYHDDLYVFTQHRLTHRSGRLSLSYSVPAIKYIDIRAIDVLQDIPGRIFNYGTIEIGTAAQEDSELCMEGVLAPKKIADFVDNLRSHSRKKFNIKADEDL